MLIVFIPRLIFFRFVILQNELMQPKKFYAIYEIYL